MGGCEGGNVSMHVSVPTQPGVLCSGMIYLGHAALVQGVNAMQQQQTTVIFTRNYVSDLPGQQTAWPCPADACSAVPGSPS